MHQKDGPLMKASQDNRYIEAQHWIDSIAAEKNGWQINTWTTGIGIDFWQGELGWVSVAYKIYRLHILFGHLRIFPDEVDIEPRRRSFILECVKQFDKDLTASN